MKKRLPFERLILLLALAGGLPGTVVALVLLWINDYPQRTQWTLTVLVLTCWLCVAGIVQHRVVFPLRTLSNLLAALREGDYSFRMRSGETGDALGGVMVQVNAMAATLREQRLSAMEATALLRKAMGEIDVAIFAFDNDDRLKLINRAGERLIGKGFQRIADLSAEDLGLSRYLEEDTPPVVRASFAGAAGLWSIRRTEFRDRGLPHVLLVITDLTRPLREEELAAWQRLVRVLSHEINNSLAPVKSISRSLADLLAQDSLPSDWREDARSGLLAIENRSEALGRFTGSYARLARLPSPELRPVSVREWVARVTRMETRLQAEVLPGPEVTIPGDADQLEQALINLLRNGVDASLARHTPQIGSNGTRSGVRLRWALDRGFVNVVVEDDGAGIANPSNLFVPFFTTKPQGSGIGLVLSRQIAEAHGGELTLANRSSAGGCEATLKLPLGSPNA